MIPKIPGGLGGEEGKGEGRRLVRSEKYLLFLFEKVKEGRIMWLCVQRVGTFLG